MNDRPDLRITTQEIQMIVGDLTIRLEAAFKEIVRLQKELKEKEAAVKTAAERQAEFEASMP